MPIGMFGLAILLLARQETGSFAVAGRVAGAFGLANAIGADVVRLALWLPGAVERHHGK